MLEKSELFKLKNFIANKQIKYFRQAATISTMDWYVGHRLCQVRKDGRKGLTKKKLI